MKIDCKDCTWNSVCNKQKCFIIDNKVYKQLTIINNGKEIFRQGYKPYTWRRERN